MSLALSISALFISLLQLINGPQSACLASASSPAPVIVIFHLTSMYASLQSHKIDFSTVALNLFLLLVLYTPLY